MQNPSLYVFSKVKIIIISCSTKIFVTSKMFFSVGVSSCVVTFHRPVYWALSMIIVFISNLLYKGYATAIKILKAK